LHLFQGIIRDRGIGLAVAIARLDFIQVFTFVKFVN